MQANDQQIDALRKLQEADRIRLQSMLALEKLPQPAQAKEIRQKLEAVVAKLAQVQKLHDESSNRLDQLLHEDEDLASKQAQVQESIDEAQGDYRIVTSLTRDLEGMAKRRETVAFEMDKIESRIKEVDVVLGQAMEARDALVRKEEDLAAAYRKEGGDLKATAEAAMGQRGELAKTIPEDVLADYERVLAKCGGIALTSLDGDRCGACRSVLDPNRMLQVRKDAPLAHCPHCGRIIVVEEADLS